MASSRRAAARRATSSAGPTSASRAVRTPRQSGAHHIDASRVRSALGQVDKDHNFEKRELETLLDAVFGQHLSGRRLNAVWDTLNADYEGAISFGEARRARRHRPSTPTLDEASPDPTTSCPSTRAAHEPTAQPSTM